MSNTVKAKPGKYAGQVIVGKRYGRIWATIITGGLVMPGMGAITAQPAMAAESVTSFQFGSQVHVPGSSVAVPISEREFRQRANQEINFFLINVLELIPNVHEGILVLRFHVDVDE